MQIGQDCMTLAALARDAQGQPRQAKYGPKEILSDNNVAQGTSLGDS